jgi:hypothetical protein
VARVGLALLYVILCVLFAMVRFFVAWECVMIARTRPHRAHTRTLMR